MNRFSIKTRSERVRDYIAVRWESQPTRKPVLADPDASASPNPLRAAKPLGCSAVAGLFCLTALAVLPGCQTKLSGTSAADVADTAQNRAVHSVHRTTLAAAASTNIAPIAPHDSNAINTIEEPATPSFPPDKRKVAAHDLPSTNSDLRPKIFESQSTSTTPPYPTVDKVDSTAQSTAGAADTGHISIAVPPVALTVPRPVARMTLAESQVPTAAPATAPHPFSLPTPGIPAAAVPASRSPVIVTASPLDEFSPAQTGLPSCNFISSIALAPTTLFFPDPLQSLNFPVATATAKIQNVYSNQFMILPLPDAAPVPRQNNAGQSTRVLCLSNWLSEPVLPPRPDPSPARDVREILHRDIYQFILGNP